MKYVPLLLFVLSVACESSSRDSQNQTESENPPSENADVDSPADDPGRLDPDPAPETVQPIAPVVSEQTIDASSAAETVYLILSQGALVRTTVDQPWLFAVKRTQFQTNSGTSGTRGVGVHNSMTNDFEAVSSCSNLTYTHDEMLPASGAPGSQPYSGNAVLNAWYDYDFMTHVVTSKQLVYALSDGQECLKFQILNYASGVYTVKISEVFSDQP